MYSRSFSKQALQRFKVANFLSTRTLRNAGIGVGLGGGLGHVLSGGTKDDFIDLLGKIVKPGESGAYKDLVDAAKQQIAMENQSANLIAQNANPGKTVINLDTALRGPNYAKSVVMLGLAGGLRGAVHQLDKNVAKKVNRKGMLWR